jgi:surface antigen
VQPITKQAWEKNSRAACGVMKLVTVAFICLPAVGCMGTGFGLSDNVDAGLTTQSTPAAQRKPVDSDETTIRNAVSSADLGRLKGDPLPWANTDTGSAGVVTGITQTQAGEVTCRDFTTTSHSFRGISKFSGTTCLTPSGEWKIVSFAKQD